MTSTLADAPAVPRPVPAQQTVPRTAGALPAPARPAVLQREPARPRLRPVRYEPAPGADCSEPLPPPILVGLPADAPTTHAQRAEARRAEAQQAEAQRAATRVLRLALEVLDGRRPAGHLDGHLAPPVSRYWRAATQQRRMCAPARFRRIRLCQPHSGAAEVAATCDIDGRPRALAARFDRRDSRWVCTALRLV